MSPRTSIPSPHGWLIPVWLLLAAMVMLWGLGEPALIDPDEGRNALTALEMAQNGEYLAPSINGVTYIDKPFFFFAAAAVCLELFGRSELSARLAPLLLTWATIGLTAWFAAGSFGRRAALVAGVALATTPLAIAFARAVIFDSTLSFFVTLATIALYRAIESPGEPTAARLWVAIAWAAIAFGIFTKGPVALLLPLLVAVPYGLWRGQSRIIWHPAGWGSLLALVVPWLWVMEIKVPGFLEYSLMSETWQRLTTDELQRTGPIWYFLPYLLGGAFPWIFLALAGGWRGVARQRAGGRDHRVVFLLLWLLLPLLFFSLSQSKRPQYILPLMPAVALLAAHAWDDDGARRRGGRAAAIAWALFGGILLLATGDLLDLRQRLEPALADLMLTTARRFGLVALASGIATWLTARRRALSLVILSLPLVALPMIIGPLLVGIAEKRSARELARSLTPWLEAGGEVIGVNTLPPSLPFYLDRPILLSSAIGDKLTSNYIVHLYPTLVDDEAGTLRSANWWHAELARCSAPHLFILRSRHDDARQILEAAGLKRIYASPKLLAYGPCSPAVPRRPPADEPVIEPGQGGSG